jgi:hypothetical protein
MHCVRPRLPARRLPTSQPISSCFLMPSRRDITKFVMAGRMRGYATHLQDRIICLEENLRLARILPVPLLSRMGELSDSQIVGLRFASDAELPALVQRVLDERLSGSDIKKAVQEWRPDYSRV